MQSQEDYKRIFETSKDVLYLTSRKGRFIDINQAGVELFGYTKEDLLNLDLSRNLYVYPSERKKFQKKIEKDGFVKDYEVAMKKKDGTIIYVSITANIRKDRNGEILGYEGIIRDITQNIKEKEEISRLYEETRYLAERDSLTNLFNRRQIIELLEYETERAKRTGDVFSIMMLDVDDQKIINDAYGHVVGDTVIKEVANILRDTIRKIDSAGRHGGDEFMIILPDTNGEKAKNLAERISKKTKHKGIAVGRTDISIRLSIGIATYPYDSMLPQELITIADRGMYESKLSKKYAVSASTPEVSKFLAEKIPSFPLLQSLVNVINSKDLYTKSHSELVTNYTLLIGTWLDLSPDQMEALRIAGLLHDVGKIGIPATVVRKPGPLGKEEWNLIRQHPGLGATMIDGLPHKNREDIAGAIMYHHERYDGKGYPGRLKGEDIPLLARVVAVADAYSAMVTERPYRRALTMDEAIEELKRESGKQFDPDIVSVFIECLST